MTIAKDAARLKIVRELEEAQTQMSRTVSSVATQFGQVVERLSRAKADMAADTDHFDAGDIAVVDAEIAKAIATVDQVAAQLKASVSKD